MRYSWILACLPMLLFVPPASISAQAQTRVEVAPVFRSISQATLYLTMNGLVPLSFGTLRKGDRVTVGLTRSRDVRVAFELVPSAGLETRIGNLPRAPLFGSGAPGPLEVFPQIRQITESADYSGLLYSNDWWFGSADVTLEFALERRLTRDEQAGLVQRLTSLANVVDGMFVTPSFTIRSGACGMVNAYSQSPSGDIMLCSELLNRLDGADGVFYGVFFHELGHTLLRLWGIPGSKQEDMEDQFAVFMLLQFQGGIGMVADFASYFQSNSNPWLDAQQIIQYGDTHSIGVARYRNINTILRDPERFMQEWNGQVYGRMQTAHLRRIAQDPRPFESPRLAQSVLNQRLTR